MDANTQSIGLRVACPRKLIAAETNDCRWTDRTMMPAVLGEVQMRAQIKEKLARAQATVTPLRPEQTFAAQMTERHYTFNELASMWNLSYEKVRRLFAGEHGTVPFGDTYRIPESVVRRVYTRLANH